MLLMVGMFLFNMLCGLVPCDPKYTDPHINEVPYPEIDIRDGRLVEKSSIPARVSTRYGVVEGYHMRSSEGRIFYAFEGIEYGTADRFQSPKPIRKFWRGTLQAKKPGSDCLQISLAKIIRVHGNERCLYLNVFTSAIPDRRINTIKLPVVVYFHSGSYMMGSGSEHGPVYLLNEDVVLITVNYRLGVFGFLSTGDSALPGNWGLKDQAIAIEWVAENIASFGGDPDNINLWGYSAGGASIHLHMMSNKTRHLFTKGISNGGNAFQHWAVQPPWRARYYANRIAKRFGCPVDDSEDLKTCLLSTSPYSLAANQLNLFDWFPFPATLFAPTIEPEHPEAFLTEWPEDAYRLGRVAKKPWVLSTTKEEGLTGVLVMELLLGFVPFKIRWKSVAKHYLDYALVANNPDEITEKVTKFYFRNKPKNKRTQFDYAKPLTDRLFHVGIRKGLQAHSEIAPTYSYMFSFSKGSYNMGNMAAYKSHEWGAGHSEDDYFLFNCTTQHPGFKKTDPEYQVSRLMINLLYNFIITGEPTFTNSEGENLKIWEPVRDGANIRMLQIDEEVKMIPMPNMDRLQFWLNLGLNDTTPWVPLKNRTPLT